MVGLSRRCASSRPLSRSARRVNVLALAPTVLVKEALTVLLELLSTFREDVFFLFLAQFLCEELVSLEAVLLFRLSLPPVLSWLQLCFSCVCPPGIGARSNTRFVACLRFVPG